MRDWSQPIGSDRIDRKPLIGWDAEAGFVVAVGDADVVADVAAAAAEAAVAEFVADAIVD